MKLEDLLDLEVSCILTDKDNDRVIETLQLKGKNKEELRGIRNNIVEQYGKNTKDYSSLSYEKFELWYNAMSKTTCVIDNLIASLGGEV